MDLTVLLMSCRNKIFIKKVMFVEILSSKLGSLFMKNLAFIR